MITFTAITIQNENGTRRNANENEAAIALRFIGAKLDQNPAVDGGFLAEIPWLDTSTPDDGISHAEIGIAMPGTDEMATIRWELG